MNTVTLAFGKDKTAIIKGIAILFMMILHCGGSGATYDVPIRTMDSYPILGFILHLMLMSICGMTANYLPSEYKQIYMYFNPLCVFFLSIVVTYSLAKTQIIKL